MNEGLRQVTADTHKWLEAYALPKEADPQDETMRRDYERAASDSERAQSLLLGNLWEFIEASRTSGPTKL
jgi:hypothetical protein